MGATAANAATSVASSIFSYGSYTLSRVRTKSFQHVPVYDPSGTDFLYTRFTLTVEGILAEGLAPLTTGERAAQALRRIEHDFLRPRQPLLYSQDGKVILEVRGNNAEVVQQIDPASMGTVTNTFIGVDSVAPALDADNGPKPQYFNVILMTQKAITVEFSIVVCLIDCRDSTARKRGYTSNRWSETETYDQSGMCQLTTRGLLICASDLKVNPDQLRDIVAPVIRNGYQRTSSTFTLSEDGLRLSYNFTDKEFYLGPPYPAKKASGQFLVCWNSGRYHAQCSIRLEGDKSASKQDLMRRALQIVNAKVSTIVPQAPPKRKKVNPSPDATGALGGGGVVGAVVAGNSGSAPPESTYKKQPIVTNATFSEHLYENTVEIQFRCQIDPKALGTVGSGAKLSMFGTELPGSPASNQPGIAPPLRGNNRFLQLLAASFNDPCVMKSLGETELRASTGDLGETSLTGTPTRSDSPGESPGNMPATLTTPQSGSSMSGATLATYSYTAENPATITVGPVTEALYSAPLKSGGSELPYEFYTVKLTYANKTGCDVLPSAWAGSNHKKVRIHNQVLTIITEWVAERVGDPPEIPDPCPDDPNYVLTDTLTTTDELLPIDGGGYLYRLSGRMTHKCINTALVPLVSALPPFIVAEIREKIGSGGLLSSQATTPTESAIAAIDDQIAAAQSQLDYTLQLASASATPAMYSSQIAMYQENIAALSAQRNGIVDTTIPPTKRRREAEFTLSSDIVWYRLKTQTPGVLFEDCDNHMGSSSTARTLIGSGDGNGGDWGDPVAVGGFEGLLTTP